LTRLATGPAGYYRVGLSYLSAGCLLQTSFSVPPSETSHPPPEGPSEALQGQGQERTEGQTTLLRPYCPAIQDCADSHRWERTFGLRCPSTFLSAGECY
ncbi:hypothetical protein NPIL_252791, partial [Nephila pilipes]